VRGKEVSKKPFLIIKEVKQLAEEGFKEIVLLGQNVNSYGQDLDSSEKIDFADLLLEVSKIEGIGHIRFMTSHPKDFSLKLIKAINERENICEHIHLPLQSGSNKILKLMNRKYTREYYLDLVNNIRKYSPETAITTDIIVGFPGEQDEDFQQTMEMVDTVKFDAAFTFVYSPRKGTPAAKFSEQVPPEIKKQRITALVKKQQEISLEKNKQYINKVLRVLVEGRSKHNKSMLTGRAGNNKIVHFPFADGLIGEFVNIKIKEARSQFLIGEKTKEGRFII
ncbi:MAG: MiaB/RimO family radical SAM methylthiotransferase, partial [Firmicutes bacterium]|nr:MiaB/RimO family radical SAM methylthiotransferase [Bacillota bacterium]